MKYRYHTGAYDVEAFRWQPPSAFQKGLSYEPEGGYPEWFVDRMTSGLLRVNQIFSMGDTVVIIEDPHSQRGPAYPGMWIVFSANQVSFIGHESFLENFKPLPPEELNDAPQRTALEGILAERKRQLEKWGIQRHDDGTWFKIINEELGEASQASLHDQFGGKAAGTLRTEAIHLAAVCLQFVEALDRRALEKDSTK